MYTIQCTSFRYSIDGNGNVRSCYNRLTGHEYVFLPENLWKLIYKEGERTEIPVYSSHQKFHAQISNEEDGKETLTMTYDGLQGDGRRLEVSLRLRFVMDTDRMSVYSFIDNHDCVEIMELQLTAASGIRSLSGAPEKDTLAWPLDLGRKVRNPAFSDLSVYAGFRKYERHDQHHTDMDGLYPGRLGMQWYDLYNEAEGFYVSAHNTSHQTLCLHVERDVKTNILRMGVILYPMAKKGEHWQGEPVVYAPHAGDWHAGAHIYRNWLESTGWTPPEQPEWIKEFKGWLRVILKQHHGELNWSYYDIPRLYDEAAAAGLDTIFLLGWEKHGFARMWPDYELDESMGGKQALLEGIQYVHDRGGRVVMFLSYLLIDRQSEFYKCGKGEEVTIKSCWQTEVPFSETYCGEGTWRKIGNPAMPMYYACPSSQIWEDKMVESAKYCLDLGADGVLYDLGGHPAYFCFDERHGHKKPNFSFADKDKRFKTLHDYIRSYGSDKAIMMEDNIDIFAQHMDISQGSSTKPANNHMLELYRYTLPECIMTNRECGQDEENYRTLANYSFLYGLRFDMTIYRCCGTLSDIPNYAAYITRLNALRAQYGKYLLKGRFTDTEGFAIDNSQVTGKAYRSEDGELAVVLWNGSDKAQNYILRGENGRTINGTLLPDSVEVVELKES